MLPTASSPSPSSPSFSLTPTIPPFPAIEYLIYARDHYDILGDNIDLASSNVPDFEPRDLDGLTVDAMNDIGAPARFRAVVAAHYELPLARVAPMFGSSTGMYCALASLIKPGDTVAVELPTYEPLFRVPQGLGATVNFFHRRPEERYALDPASAMAALGDTGRVVVLADPNNPTGIAADPEALRDLACRLAARNGYLIVNEVYREFLHDRDGTVTAHKLAKNIITTASFTKVFGLGWARSGWLFGPEPLIAEALERQYHMTGRFGFTYAAVGCLALAQLDRLLARSREFVGDKLDLIDAFVAAHPELSWVRPPAGIFGFLRFRDGRSADPLLAAARRHRLILAPGKFFGDDSAFRLGGRSPRSDFVAGLARLSTALTEPPPAT